MTAPRRPKKVPPEANFVEGEGWHAGELRNGEREGLWRTWNEEGVLIEESTYVGGILNGPQRMWWEDGSLRREGPMEGGVVANGLHVRYAPPGNKKSWRPWRDMLSPVLVRGEGVMSDGRWISFRWFDKNGHERTPRGKALDPAVAKADQEKNSAQKKLAKLLGVLLLVLLPTGRARADAECFTTSLGVVSSIDNLSHSTRFDTAAVGRTRYGFTDWLSYDGMARYEGGRADPNWLLTSALVLEAHPTNHLRFDFGGGLPLEIPLKKGQQDLGGATAVVGARYVLAWGSGVAFDLQATTLQHARTDPLKVEVLPALSIYGDWDLW